MRARIDSLLNGKVAPLGPEGKPSGIAKTPVDVRLSLGLTGLEGDSQADLKNHGGTEKAVHHYPRDHYAFWQRQLPHHSEILDDPGAFGENISTMGITEDAVCIGDIYELGSAVVQVSQARQPCWKLNARFEYKAMAATVQSTRFSGWYYRVLSEGDVEAGDSILLVDRLHEDWPLTRLMAIIYDKSQDERELLAMSDLEALAPNWQNLAKKRLATRKVEDWSDRLGS